ncbi:protein of unknown function [Thiomonas sp. Bio17B3]|nr:protein of unknown function [Thiomonas sp. Bio17B3]VDY10060.1 protein of unknown function [Thiomonas sp. Sup16B3]VDY14002.1 protein of unknown function [Thiomonas sp. OC7]VDY15905.1 protein of unknown function [Thiomonas sp. CB2]VDY06644.1 protein of unknown function [Thiomonas sp. Bio17B3]
MIIFWMAINMDNSRLSTSAQLEQFLSADSQVGFTPYGDDAHCYVRYVAATRQCPTSLIRSQSRCNFSRMRSGGSGQQSPVARAQCALEIPFAHQPS